MSQTASTKTDLINKVLPIVFQFRLAEKAIKSAEQCETNISLTALNQSKNAFNHLCIALLHYEKSEFEAADENFRKSVGHCKRAFYDACDAEITFCLIQINLFISHCRSNQLPLHDVVHQYAEAASLIVDAKHFLESDQLEISDKDERYRKAQEYRDKIKSQIHDRLHGYYEVANEKIALINKLKADNDKKDIENRRLLRLSEKSLMWTKVSGIVAIVAILVAVLLVVFESDLKGEKKSTEADVKQNK